MYTIVNPADWATLLRLTICLGVTVLCALMYEVKFTLRKPLSTAAIALRIREDLQLSKVHATSISAKQNGPIREPL